LRRRTATVLVAALVLATAALLASLELAPTGAQAQSADTEVHVLS
jgi:hypothetical protein